MTSQWTVDSPDPDSSSTLPVWRSPTTMSSLVHQPFKSLLEKKESPIGHRLWPDQNAQTLHSSTLLEAATTTWPGTSGKSRPGNRSMPPDSRSAIQSSLSQGASSAKTKPQRVLIPHGHLWNIRLNTTPQSTRVALGDRCSPMMPKSLASTTPIVTRPPKASLSL